MNQDTPVPKPTSAGREDSPFRVSIAPPVEFWIRDSPFRGGEVLLCTLIDQRN